MVIASPILSNTAFVSATEAIMALEWLRDFNTASVSVYVSAMGADGGTRKNAETMPSAKTSPKARMAYPSEARRRELVKIARINRSIQTKLIIINTGAESDFMKVS
jgi:hypothetical protein